MDKLPKVSIGIIAVIVAQVGGYLVDCTTGITISSLADVSQLSAQSEVQDKVNMQRDILANADRLDDIELDINDVWDDLEMAWDDLEGMTQHMMEIVKLQSRIAILEKTLEFTRKDGM